MWLSRELGRRWVELDEVLRDSQLWSSLML